MSARDNKHQIQRRSHVPATGAGSENWIAADGTPVQFTDDPVLAGAVASAGEIVVDGVTLRVIRAVDLLHEKVRAGSDPARRRSKRLQVLADAEALLETNPDLAKHLRPDERAILDRLLQEPPAAARHRMLPAPR